VELQDDGLDDDQIEVWWFISIIESNKFNNSYEAYVKDYVKIFIVTASIFS
jgi:hypothetical protein